MHFDYTGLTAESIHADVAGALETAEEIVERIVTAPESSYDTILAPIDEIRDLVTRTDGRTGFMGYVHPEPDVRAAGKEAEAKLNKWMVELLFRDDLYAAVRRFSESEEASRLEGERARSLRFLMRDFRRAGQELAPDVRKTLRRLTNRLVELAVEFEQNIAEHRDVLLVTAEDLDGLPDWFIDTLEPSDDGTHELTMAYPHVVPFLENARRRDLRETLSLKFNTRAAVVNRPLLEEAIAIRHQIAGLFGLPSWAHHQLEVRMARHPEAVEAFYAELSGPLTEAARTEIARMTDMLREEHDDELRLWDWRYYDTQLRKTDYGVDPTKVAEYFRLERVIEGLFEITGEVFGLRYEPAGIPSWHDDVTTYAIRDADSGALVSHFHMDLFPREGKFSHAAAFTLVPGRRLPDGRYQPPVSAIVANFPKPNPSRPSLLQHDDVETLFHEFGHVLHQTLSRTELVLFSGTNTERDFVEAPSQIMEHWAWKPDVLSRFARHHETGEPIPTALVERLVAARRLNIALFTLRQILYGTLDLRLHGPEGTKDVDRILRETTEIGLLPFQEGTFFPASFGHLFGYDAGYYGYLWSEVYGDDMFSRFEKEGYTSPEVGRDYRRLILERGGALEGMDLLREFLGREPNNEAFLRNLGITS